MTAARRFSVSVTYGIALPSSVVVEVAADDDHQARCLASDMVTTWLRFRHPDQELRPLTAHSRQRSPDPVDGASAYVLTRRDRIARLALPARLDGEAGERLAQQLEGLDPAETFAVVFDLAGVESIATPGLGALVSQRQRLRLALCAPSATVRHVFDAVGLPALMPIHADLAHGLAALTP